MKSKRIVGLWICAFTLLTWTGMLLMPSAGHAKKTILSGKMSMVPDRFLRRWDPVTVFFENQIGPPAGAPEDHPQKFVTLTPAHPGVFQWLDGRTLQFRPVEPWPPLSRYTWRIHEHQTELVTLMSAPLKTIPAHGDSGLDPVETLTLYFPEPVAPEELKKMIAIELRPLPGVGNLKVQWLHAAHFEIKILERKSPSSPAAYVLIFQDPIPSGTLVTLHLKLSVADQTTQSFKRIQFSTAESFRITHFGTTNQLYPLTRQGVRYTPQQAIQGDPSNRTIEVLFSSPPSDSGPVEIRNLVRFNPSVGNLNFEMAGEVLLVSGNFSYDTLYKLTLAPAELTDEKGRPLDMANPGELFFYFPPRPDYLNLRAGQGIVERYGSQMIPLEGRGFERVDLRIHPVDPLDRSLWPFPDRPVYLDEEKQPPRPGEEPSPHVNPDRHVSVNELRRHLSTLGSPSVSTLVSLPLTRSAGAFTFGLDLEPFLAKIFGKSQPGTCLLGIRKLDGSRERAWIRIQVTDLCLTTVEAPDQVKFVVTSLSSGMPVYNARIRMEGMRKKSGRKNWEVILAGRTNSRGIFLWRVPGDRDASARYHIRRIVISKANDTLVLDPTRPPDRFAHNHWSKSRATWLQWTLENIEPRLEKPRYLGHIFSDRTVYRPDEPVHIKGYARQYHRGELSLASGSGVLVVQAPGAKEFRYPLDISPEGSFYHQFNEEKLPTGEFTAWFELDDTRMGDVRFRKEAYRLPKFQVDLHGPDTVSLDGEFSVRLTAKYYAGGSVNDRPVRWRVTQFPYTWAPKKKEGYYYATDARFSGQGTFRSRPVRKKEDRTDDEGSGRIDLNPALEPTAQPRKYIVEATVTGADDQTVTNTHQILALPPFTLGLKVPRYLKRATSINPEIIVSGPDGELISGKQVRLRLLQRQWHSHLQAGDFSQGQARYVTDVVDEKIYETMLTSGPKPLHVKIPIKRAGVYIVEIEARDKVGRSQSVSVDLFAGGDQPVTWVRPPTRVFKVTPERKEYAPGQTAVLILESPFQDARALAIVEAPDGRNIYQWLTIRKGSAVFELLIHKNYLPRIPVHFMLMRGRIHDGTPLKPGAPDLHKPVTLAATTWISVSAAEHRANLELTHPSKARPGQEIEVELKLADDQGNPLSGEATLWLVDQAVLALGREQRLDPLPDFIVKRHSRFSFRDTRNLAFGRLPLQEMPGGGEAEPMKEALLDRVTVRKTIKPVPYFNPSIQIGKNGYTKVRVKLPDNLTNFKLRAKVVSNPDRFGFATGHLSVRLPVIVQPALPRFVRPGDRFIAAGIGRIVEGDGGPGKAAIKVKGLELQGASETTFIWEKSHPRRFSYDVSVSTPAYSAEAKSAKEVVTISMGAERQSDGAADAFAVTLPIHPDRHPVVERRLLKLESGHPLSIPAIIPTVRAGTLKRTISIARHPAIARMAAGLDFLMHYPHGCTEQRISRVRSQLAANRFRELLHQKSPRNRLQHSVAQTIQWIDSVKDEKGLAAYWPGSKGYVSLTAWVVQFLLEARQAGFHVDPTLWDTFITALKRSLRSDYQDHVDGEALAERCWALTALTAAGEADSGYVAELARKADYLNLESTAQIARILCSAGMIDSPSVHKLSEKIWGGIVTRLFQGKEVYSGLQKPATDSSPLLLPSETRTLAQVLRGIYACDPKNDARRRLLVDALVAQGHADGWGSTNANHAALTALAEFLSFGAQDQAALTIDIRSNNTPKTVVLEAGVALEQLVDTHGEKMEIDLKAGGNTAPLAVRVETAYVPEKEGSRVTAQTKGFVVHRELLKFQDQAIPAQRIKLSRPAQTIRLSVSDIMEEHIEVVNPVDRTFVAIVIPLAAGMEPLNPNLATSPPEAAPSGRLTQAPAYVAYMDDHMAYYYDRLPKGTYHFYFRTRAFIPGSFIQPPAYAEMMYDQAVAGNSNGAMIVIVPAAKP